LKDIDHIIYATLDLDLGVERIEALLGVRPVRGGQHPGYGTRNALLSLGPDVYLEIIGPDPAQPDPDRPRVFDIDEIDAPRLTAWAAKGTDLMSRVREAKGREVEFGEVLSGGRDTPDGTFLSWQVTAPHVRIGDGLVPFLIDWGETPHPAQSAPSGCRLLNFTAEHPDPVRLQRLLAAAGFELTVLPGPAPALIATLETPGGTVELR
jgi:hypothetical protein